MVALTGFMGAGKSSVGAALGEHLGWTFRDLDAEIERREGRNIRDIFLLSGEARFREIESATLAELLEGAFTASATLVLALGGGTFAQPGNAALLHSRAVEVVFLETSLETMLQRCCNPAEPEFANLRPLASDRQAFQRLYEERLPLYRGADLTIRTDGREAADVAREIAATLGLANLRTPANQ